jgi:anti-sigma B factor antagonist
MGMAAVIAFEGEIDLHHSGAVREQLEPHIATREPQIVVDLTNVSYLDSSGLAVFIEAMQRVQAYGGKFALCGLRESVRHIFAVACLDQVFRIFPDQAAALSA